MDVTGAVSTGPVALLTLFVHIDVDRLCLSEDRIHEIDAHLHEAVVSLTRSGIGPPIAASAKTAAKEGAEYILEASKTGEVAALTETAKPGTIHTSMPELVIGRFLLRIAEDLIRLVDLLEFFLCPRFLVDVRVIFFGHFAVCFFDFFLAGTLAQPEDLIVISFFAHHGSPLFISGPPICGRSCMLLRIPACSSFCKSCRSSLDSIQHKT